MLFPFNRIWSRRVTRLPYTSYTHTHLTVWENFVNKTKTSMPGVKSLKHDWSIDITFDLPLFSIENIEEIPAYVTKEIMEKMPKGSGILKDGRITFKKRMNFFLYSQFPMSVVCVVCVCVTLPRWCSRTPRRPPAPCSRNRQIRGGSPPLPAGRWEGNLAWAVSKLYLFHEIVQET